MGILSALRLRSHKRRAYVSLLTLDDHLLRDIGIDRSDLHLMMAGTRTPYTRSGRRND